MNGRQLVEWILHEASIPTVDEVCTMPGRSRGECWGCPVTKCPRQVTPFEVEQIDAEVIAKAIQKLKSNQIWVGDKSGREIYDWLTADSDASHDSVDSRASRRLLGLLIESRETFLLNQAVEAVATGHQSVEQAAASVRFLSTKTTDTKNIWKFRKMVQDFVTRQGKSLTSDS